MKLILLVLTVVAARVPPLKVNFLDVIQKPRIIGGEEAVPHSIPSQVLVELFSNGSIVSYCGGTLISLNYVLTAGHCVEGKDEARITLGAHKVLETEDTQVKVVSKELTLHPEYDSYNILNDIGVIKLPEPIQLTDAIQPINLTRTNDSYDGKIGRLSGWGLTDGAATSLSPVLNYVDVAIITLEECREAFTGIPDSNICTSGDDNKSSCNGDSGGPLIVDGVQVGVVSWGVIFCMSGYPTGFSRISSFLGWIANNTDIVI